MKTIKQILHSILLISISVFTLPAFAGETNFILETDHNNSPTTEFHAGGVWSFNGGKVYIGDNPNPLGVFISKSRSNFGNALETEQEAATASATEITIIWNFLGGRVNTTISGVTIENGELYGSVSAVSFWFDHFVHAKATLSAPESYGVVTSRQTLTLRY